MPNTKQPELLATFDTARADRWFARFRANNTWQTSTLVVLRVGSSDPDTGRLDHLAPALTEPAELAAAIAGFRSQVEPIEALRSE